MEKPAETLISQRYSRPWIRDYALGVAKTILGEARGKFNTIAGPQGGTTLNGGELKQEKVYKVGDNKVVVQPIVQPSVTTDDGLGVQYQENEATVY